VLSQTPINKSDLIMSSIKLHGNLHPKYASFKDGQYTTTCEIVSILGCSVKASVKVTYSVSDINWLNDFWFRDSARQVDILCVLDRWYFFETSTANIDCNIVKLGDIYVTSIDEDTDIERARKRRSLRLTM
jgi:hypothetical protein